LKFNHNGHLTGNDRTGSLFTMKRCIYALILLASSGNVFGQAPTLEDLPAARDFESHRITSFDPSGGNADYWDIKPGETRVLAEIQGPGRIVHLRDNVTGFERHHLQLHVLRMYWDGENEPSVEVPFGDFFGVGFGFTEKFDSALLSIDQRRGRLTDPAASGAARNCYIPMPFARSARITVTNEGTKPSRHWVEINYRTYKTAPADQFYFHAQYRQATPPPEGPYLILDAKGRGHLLGCVLSVKNNEGGWWGEGDEILFIDGNHAIQGTGTEDYFCESYGIRPGCFPNFGVTVCEEPFNGEHRFNSAYRWHVPDPVTFQESLRFLIEHGNGNPPCRSRNYYYSVAYWYQTEPHAPFPQLPSTSERIRWAAGDVQGAIEGESMRILSKTGGVTEIQWDTRWSGSKQLWWRNARPGDRLELALPAAAAGQYRLAMNNTRADDYGVFQFYLDGEKLGEPVDFYSAANIVKQMTLGDRRRTEGPHRFVVEVAGSNPAAKPGYMFGLDYITLEPLDGQSPSPPSTKATGLRNPAVDWGRQSPRNPNSWHRMADGESSPQANR
jgi:hypothetical protein